MGEGERRTWEQFTLHLPMHAMVDSISRTPSSNSERYLPVAISKDVFAEFRVEIINIFHSAVAPRKTFHHGPYCGSNSLACLMELIPGEPCLASETDDGHDDLLSVIRVLARGRKKININRTTQISQLDLSRARNARRIDSASIRQALGLPLT
jgi:hypothetical protein